MGGAVQLSMSKWPAAVTHFLVLVTGFFLANVSKDLPIQMALPPRNSVLITLAKERLNTDKNVKLESGEVVYFARRSWVNQEFLCRYQSRPSRVFFVEKDISLLVRAEDVAVIRYGLSKGQSKGPTYTALASDVVGKSLPICSFVPQVFYDS
jgi:hypothetical protein